MSQPLPHLVLLPGLDGSGAFFADLVAALGDSVATSILSYPATGPQTYEALATQLAPHLPSTDYVLLGESFGGPLAILLAERARMKPKGIIITASFVRNPWPLMGGIISAALPNFVQQKSLPVIEATLVRKGDYPLAYRIFQAISALKPDILAGRVKAALGSDVRKSLGALTMPMLYIQGRHDKLITAAQGKLMQLTARNMRLVGVDTPHFVLQYEVEHTVREVILPFLTDLK